jgi:uncharacterized damage-inducible protein DinB
MADLDEHGRPEPPLEAGEATMLRAFLDYQRATLAWKCERLHAEGLRATVGASTMTLGGLLKHMALVEASWFTRWLHGRDIGPPWNAVDWDADNDWEWNSAADHWPAPRLRLHGNVRRTRATARVAAEAYLGQLAKRRWPDGRSPSLRWILCHMIEEYARHNGHADLLRESVDGETGE